MLPWECMSFGRPPLLNPHFEQRCYLMFDVNPSVHDGVHFTLHVFRIKHFVDCYDHRVNLVVNYCGQMCASLEIRANLLVKSIAGIFVSGIGGFGAGACLEQLLECFAVVVLAWKQSARMPLWPQIHAQVDRGSGKRTCRLG